MSDIVVVQGEKQQVVAVGPVQQYTGGGGGANIVILGTVADQSELPAEGNAVGDGYIIAGCAF